MEVLVTYPWLPPTCSHCKELGHIAKNCLLIPLPQKAPPHQTKKLPTPSPTTKTYVPKHPKNSTPNSTPSTSSPPTNSTPSIPPPTNSAPSTSTFTPLPAATSVSLPPPVPEKAIILSTKFLHLPSTIRVFIATISDFNTENSPPNPRLRQSLKRSRSDPTLSPPNSSFLPPAHVARGTNINRPLVAPLLLTLPSLSDHNPYSLLATDSSLFQGKLPYLS